MRMRRQVQQDIFAQMWREIDHLRPGQIEVDRKSFCFDIEWKRIETPDAPKLDRLHERASRPERSLGDSQVERIPQRSGAADILRGEIGDGAFFLALEMQAVGVNLPEMNFHGEMTNDE